MLHFSRHPGRTRGFVNVTGHRRRPFQRSDGYAGDSGSTGSGCTWAIPASSISIEGTSLTPTSPATGLSGTAWLMPPTTASSGSLATPVMRCRNDPCSGAIPRHPNRCQFPGPNEVYDGPFRAIWTVRTSGTNPVLTRTIRQVVRGSSHRSDACRWHDQGTTNA